ncbi:hypothetical protein OKA05_04530 [Luteolibacter arcticus]|uniref:Uncharacterized protein n=1 Tax=Luteolibacter arcticus TaxID=1581411 RepID=A0ABT3GDW8_9BACT|nr:hypothetical protein [Luteolibacter arcticus]MCW1921806.1 hypothetical protein [Luteolibacter arcticus]
MIILGAVAGILIPLASAQEPARKPMRDVVTHDDIVEAARQAKDQAPLPVFKPLEGEDPSVVNRPKDLLSRSDIFSYLGQATLVPKKAVLHFPKELESRGGLKEQSKFIPWIDFYAANRSWIRTVAVSRAQAEGREPMDEDTVKSFAKEKRLVVATYQEGPISVNRYEDPATKTAAVPGKAPAVPTSTAAKP